MEAGQRKEEKALKSLIICEKPSLAKNVLLALDPSYPKSRNFVFSKDNGCYENDQYIISYCFGHLFELYDIDDYKYGAASKEHDSWAKTPLPFVPDSFQFHLKEVKGKVDPGVRKQYNNLKRLISRSDVNQIIHCGDADREGELIVRHVLEQARNRKPVYRLWLPEQTPKSILNALQTMKPDSDYDALAKEGLARTYMDWLYGINLTRYLTLYRSTGKAMRVGRVLVPIVKAIYDRDEEIEHFVSRPFYQSEHKGSYKEVPYTLLTEDHLERKEDADQITAKLNQSGPMAVTHVETRTTRSAPPKLFSLSKLQGTLSKKYKMSLKSSMKLIQGLYEKGYLSYPRTNTEYLAEEEKDKVKDILQMLSGKGYTVKFRDGKSIFDNSKIESHSALIPTYKFPSGLTSEEQKVYDTVLNRFCAVFCDEDCILQKTKVEITAGEGTVFTLSGSVVKQQGYLKYDGKSPGKVVPPFTEGILIRPNFTTKQGMTKPPAHYSAETLMNFLKNPYKEEKKGSPEDETMSDEDYRAMFEGVEIGTEATRTGIIDNAKSSGYIEEKKGIFTILPGGKDLIHTLDELKIDLYKNKSVELSKQLKAVHRGTLTVQDTVNKARAELERDIDNSKIQQKGDKKAMPKGEPIGICPQCGGNVYENDMKVYCENGKWNKETRSIDGCNFQFFKNVGPREHRSALTEDMIQDILATGETSEKITISKKDGSGTYQCYLKWNEDEGQLQFDFD